MPGPEDIRAGALPHDLPCPWCGHAPHRYLPCDCTCSHAEQLGIDTALGG